jgi:hypothetical protein
MIYIRESRGIQQHIDPRGQVPHLLLGKTASGNNTQAMFIGETQYGRNFIGGSWRNRNAWRDA